MCVILRPRWILFFVCLFPGWRYQSRCRASGGFFLEQRVYGSERLYYSYTHTHRNQTSQSIFLSFLLASSSSPPRFFQILFPVGDQNRTLNDRESAPVTLSPDLNTLPSIHPPSSLTNRVCVFWPSLFAIALTVKPHGEKEGRRVMGSLVSASRGAKWNSHGNRLFVLRYGSGRDGRCFKKNT